MLVTVLEEYPQLLHLSSILLFISDCHIPLTAPQFNHVLLCSSEAFFFFFFFSCQTAASLFLSRHGAAPEHVTTVTAKYVMFLSADL